MGYEPLPGSQGAKREPRKVSDTLDDLLRHLGSSRGETLATVFGRWTDVVGDRVAAHTGPLAVRDGALIIAVDDPAWASELRWQSARLCERARYVLNDDSIERITVRGGPDTGSGG